MKSTQTIPLIDCSSFKNNMEDVAQKLGQGFEEFGFVYLVNHDFKKEEVDKFSKNMRQFYSLPYDVKMKYKMGDPFENFFGYTSFGVERYGDDSNTKKKDTKESFDFSSPDTYDESKYPTEIPNFKESVDNFRRPFKETIENLLRGLAIYLKLDEKTFLPMHSYDYKNGSFCLLRSVVYPPKENESTNDEDLRLGIHQDLGTFTFLFQDDLGGLETQTKDGTWIPVPPIPGSIALVTGQGLECWTGGKILAPKHRVGAYTSNFDKQRQTHIFFVAADLDVPCTPLIPKQKDWIPVYEHENETTGEFIKRRFKGARY